MVAAARTTAVLPAAADEVSTGIAHLSELTRFFTVGVCALVRRHKVRGLTGVRG
jgi:hypothetical protein